MQQNLRQHVVILILGAIALGGLSSCLTTTRSSSTQTGTTVTHNTEALPIKAGSSSSTADFLRIMTTAYTSTTPTESINLLEPGQSENVIEGVKQRLINVGAISRSLKPQEENEELNFREATQDALVVATHPSVTGVTNLTTEELKGIYSGAITNWKDLGGPDAEIQLLDRPEDESAKRLLREYYLGEDLPTAPNAIVLRKEGELIQTLQSIPYSIGSFSLAYAISHNLAINRLSLNGIAPTPKHVQTGQYPMARTIGVVWHQNASEETVAFINYIFSPPGVNDLEQAGFAPITPPTDVEGK